LFPNDSSQNSTNEDDKCGDAILSSVFQAAARRGAISRLSERRECASHARIYSLGEVERGLVGSSGTARSICPAINASSISLTNRPLAADLGEQPVPAPGRRPCGSSRSLRSRPVRGEPRPNDRGRRWSGAAPSGCRGFRCGDGGTALTFLLAARSTPHQQWFQRPVSRHFHWSALCG
jgi:hypothetical protein